tara:strand:- start:18 stop:512 length:495 start_codon:yes stop_codon:yes gene_type:complete
MKVINNFLSQNVFDNIKNLLEDSRFPYYYQSSFLPSISKNNNCDFFFCHTFFRDSKQTSEDVFVKNILYPITNKLKVKKIIRAKVNLYTNQHKHIESDYHVDTDDNVNIALFSVGNNNGWTEFKTGKKFLSKENSIALFNSKLKHKVVTQTNTKRRINININYE